VQFDALPDEERDRMKSERYFGQYGLWGRFAAHSNPEVPVALRLVQLEKLSWPVPVLTDSERIELVNSEIQEKVTARFPEVTPERIQRAVARLGV
jgi:hypothetical protein